MISLLKILLSERKHRFRLLCLKAAWRKRNKHNFTSIADLCNIDLISVGRGTYGKSNVSFLMPIMNRKKIVIGVQSEESTLSVWRRP